MVDELLGRGPHPGPQHDERLHDLALGGVRHADGRRLEHGRVGIEDLVHLAGIHLESRDDDHLLLPVDDEEVAVLVHPHDVAGVQPAVAQHERRLVGPPPVAVHDVGSADAELPGLARVDLARAGLEVHDLAVDVGHGDSDRAGLARAVRRVRVRHRSGLGQAVALHHLAPGQALEAAQDVDGQRRRSREE